MHDRKWQYKVETVKMNSFSIVKSDAQLEERLMRLGMEGWELVNSIVYGASVKLFLKR